MKIIRAQKEAVARISCVTMRPSRAAATPRPSLCALAAIALLTRIALRLFVAQMALA